MKLPSSKIGNLLLLVVLIVAGIISINSFKERRGLTANLSEVNTKPSTILSIKRENTVSEIDSDNDGLKDWEEILWRTDPKNPDTDNDGTIDGTEILEERDPTVPGPEDSKQIVFQKKLEEDGGYFSDIVQGTLTDDLSINLASNYFNLKSDNSYNQVSRDQLVNAITKDVGIITEIEFKYSISDISTIPQNIDSVKSYGNKLAEIQLKYVNVLASVDTIDEDQYIEEVASLYSIYAIELSQVQVPRNLANAHISLMNNYYNIGIAMTELKDHETDPVKALLAIRKFQTIQETQVNNILAIANYLKENDIIFSEEEPGNIWNQF